MTLSPNQTSTSIEEVKKLLKEVCSIAPEWCSITQIDKALFLKINVKADFVVAKNQLIQRAMSLDSTDSSQMDQST